MRTTAEASPKGLAPWALLLLVVCACAGLVWMWLALWPKPLATAAAPDFIERARDDILRLTLAVRQYQARSGNFPDSLDVLLGDAESLSVLERDTLPLDPWGNPYGYELSTAATLPRVFSLGADGKPGGTGENQDLDATTLPPKQFLPPATRVRQDIAKLWTALTSYALQNEGRYPATLEELLTEDRDGSPYLDGNPIRNDPWGNPYGYDRPSATQAKPRIFSLGADGRPGGEGDDQDVDMLTLRAGN